MKNSNRLIKTLASTFALTGIMAFTGNSFAETSPALNKHLAQLVIETNKQLPATDSGITMQKMETVDNQLIIRSTFVHITTSEAQKELAQKEEEITQEMTRQACNNPTFKPLLDQGAIIVFNYEGNDNKFAYKVAITPNDCLASASEDETPLQVLLEKALKETKEAIEKQDPTLGITREIKVEENQFIDKYTFSTLDSQVVRNRIQANNAQALIEDKNSYCLSPDTLHLLNKGAIFVFKYHGNDNKLTFKATLDKNWCAYTDEEKLAAQKIENENQPSL